MTDEIIIGSDQHTPGPYLRAGSAVYALDETGEVNRFFCLVQGGYRIHGNYKGGVQTTEEEIEATACLLSSAPELLEALKVAERMIAREFPNGQAIIDIRAAITKAKGKT